MSLLQLSKSHVSDGQVMISIPAQEYIGNDHYGRTVASPCPLMISINEICLLELESSCHYREGPDQGSSDPMRRISTFIVNV